MRKAFEKGKRYFVQYKLEPNGGAGIVDYEGVYIGRSEGMEYFGETDLDKYQIPRSWIVYYEEVQEEKGA